MWLIFGGRGWIGQQLVEFLLQNGQQVVVATGRAEDAANVRNQILEHEPDVVFSCIGRTHGAECNTVDYLEDKLEQNLTDNLLAPLTLRHVCDELKVYLVYLGTGCIFASPQPEVKWDEQALPNFTGSGYSTVKGITDRIFHLNSTNTLNLRIRMPVTGSAHARNFITKITSYQKVINVQNSLSVLPTLFPALLSLVERRIVGTLNFTNPGTMSHHEILTLYQTMVDPNFKFTGFTVEEQNLTLKSHRSNNTLDTSRLESLCPEVPPVQDAVAEALTHYKAARDALPRKRVILVTGGLGFIASHMVAALYSQFPNCMIINADAETYASNHRNIPIHIRQDKQRYSFYQMNIINKEGILYLLQHHKVTDIFHFAAETHVDNSFESSLKFTQTNVLGTHTLLQCCLDYGVENLDLFLHVSTDEVYGDIDYAQKVKETSHLNPTNPYAATKASAEMMVRSYQTSFQLPAIIVRCNNVYGPCQYPEKVIPKFLLQAQCGLPVTIHGQGNTKRSFIYITDVVSAFLTIFTKGDLHQIYNIGVDAELSIHDLVHLHLKPQFTHLECVSVADRNFNDQRYYIDSTKLRQLGWIPVVEFETGFQLTKQWYAENGHVHWPYHDSYKLLVV